jgi:hypothetical protein
MALIQLDSNALASKVLSTAGVDVERLAVRLRESLAGGPKQA